MHHLRRAFAAVALALLVAPLVANAPLFDPDEGLHAAIAQEMVRSGDYVTPTFLGEPFLDKPILFFWTEALSLRLFGDTEFAVRVPPLLFGMAGMFAVALLGRSLFGAAAGLTAGIAYGTMLLPFGVSQVAVHDVGLIGFMALACWCLFEASTSKRSMAVLIVIAGVALGLSILTKGLVGCVFAAIFAACLAIRTPASTPRLAIVLAGAGVIALMVAAPWYIAMEQAHPGYLHYYFVERHLQGYLTATQRHAGRPWWYYIPIVAGGALPWTGYLLLALRDARADALRLVLWGWFAIGLVFLSIGESKLVTYALPLFPALALLAGDTIARRSPIAIGGGRSFRLALTAHAAFLAIVPAAGLIVLQVKFGERHPHAWAVLGAACLVTVYVTRRALRSRETNGVASWMSLAALASLAAVMTVLPIAGSWMTARDLARTLNDSGRLPPRVSVLDERIGSLVFYLSPALRAEATANRLDEASYSEAVLRVRVDPEDALLAVRNDQLERFTRLFSHPPAPDGHAGTFTLFRAGRLREALAIE
jgi:4-amino-4-deoxy-L-arabinose transferase-like glycosyltransferase